MINKQNKLQKRLKNKRSLWLRSKIKMQILKWKKTVRSKLKMRKTTLLKIKRRKKFKMNGSSTTTIHKKNTNIFPKMMRVSLTKTKKIKKTKSLMGIIMTMEKQMKCLNITQMILLPKNTKKSLFFKSWKQRAFKLIQTEGYTNLHIGWVPNETILN